MTIHEILSRLTAVRVTGEKKWVAKCPAHDDDKPSLSIAQTDKKVLIHCFAGCSTEQVVQALGIRLSDLNLDNSQRYYTLQHCVDSYRKKLGEPNAIYYYRNRSNDVVGVVIRWETSKGKEIRPASLSSGSWMMQAMSEPRPLYNLPKILSADQSETIWVVEGEKCADALNQLGFIATTSSGGANAALKSDWSPLYGRNVVLVPDNDNAGEKYVTEINSKLSSNNANVKIVRLEGVPESGDVVDWLAIHASEDCRAKLQEIAGVTNLQKSKTPTIIENAIRQIEAIVESENEGEDASVYDDILSYQNFPTALLPSIVRDYVNESSSITGSDPVYTILPLFSVLSATIGKSACVRINSSWIVWPVVWTMIIGESGTMKTVAKKRALEPLRNLQSIFFAEYEEALQEYQEQAKNDQTGSLKPPIPRQIIINDITTEAIIPAIKDNANGLLLERDELDGWIKSFDRYARSGGSDLSAWLSIFSCEPITVNRKTQRVLHVESPFVSVTGSIQPAILRETFSSKKSLISSGLFARFLFAYPPKKKKRLVVEEPNYERSAQLSDFIADYVMNKRNNKFQYVFTREANNRWNEFFNEFAERQYRASGIRATILAKMEEYIPKIALIYHVCSKDSNNLSIDIDSLDSAIDTCNWLIREGERIITLIEMDESEYDLTEIIECVRRLGGQVTARDLQRRISKIKSSAAAIVYLNELAKLNIGEWETIGKKRIFKLRKF